MRPVSYSIPDPSHVASRQTPEVVEDPPGQDPPGQDPPGPDPPGQDPPGQDPPGQDPPGQAPDVGLIDSLLPPPSALCLIS